MQGIKFKPYVPKKAKVNAVQHTGSPKQYLTEHGTETAYEGQYVVQVGDIEQTELVPPRDGKPGFTRKVNVPKLEIMSAEDFEALYEPA